MKAKNEETVEDVQANGRGDASAWMRQEERVITSRGRDAIYFYLQKHWYTALVTSFVYLPVTWRVWRPVWGWGPWGHGYPVYNLLSSSLITGTGAPKVTYSS